MEGLSQELRDLLGHDHVVTALRVTALLMVGLIGGRLLARLAARLAGRRGSAQHVMVARRAALWGVWLLVAFSVLRQLGIDIGVLLGAAGVLSVAIGFASQTSASNLISGLFLLGERSFVVGDTIRMGTTVGEVLSIDLLSVKLRTSDNLYVRVPNETLIKSEIVNLTRFPVRQIAVELRVAFTEDLDRIQRLVSEVVEGIPELFADPAPQVHVDRLGELGVQLRVLVWTSSDGWYARQGRLVAGLLRALTAAGVHLPSPPVAAAEARE